MTTLLKFPSEIAKIIQDLSNIYTQDCSTVILYGSASYNGLVYTKSSGKIDFLSDIEFIVIPKDVSNENSKVFRKTLMKKSYEYFDSNPSVGRPPFVDVNPVSLRFFSEAQPRISTFELKSNGVVLEGDNVLDLLPDVGLTNYEAKIQNIEIVKGLKILLIESNQWFLCKDNHDDNAVKAFCYFLSSSLLNILRTLLPQFGIFESIASERVMNLEKIRNHKELCQYFSQDVINEFGKIYQQKTLGEFTYSPQRIFSLTFEAYKSLLAFLIKAENDKDLIMQIMQSKSQIFFGDAYKIDLLARLTSFFISVLSCLDQLIISHDVKDEDVIRMQQLYDDMIYGNKAYAVKSIIDDYTRLERDRWNIIGSKD